MFQRWDKRDGGRCIPISSGMFGDGAIIRLLVPTERGYIEEMTDYVRFASTRLLLRQASAQ